MIPMERKILFVSKKVITAETSTGNRYSMFIHRKPKSSEKFLLTETKKKHIHDV